MTIISKTKHITKTGVVKRNPIKKKISREEIKKVTKIILSMKLKGIKDIRREYTHLFAFNITKEYIGRPIVNGYQFYINTRAYGDIIFLVVKGIEKSFSFKYKTFPEFKKKINKDINKTL